jgi:long-chain acyl-CoA synthetase
VVDVARDGLMATACPSLPRLTLHADELLATTSPSNPLGPRDLPASADALLLFTSGTTGGPKAARITHASLLAHTAALVHHTLQLGEQDVVLGALPWTHSFGLRMSVLAPFYAGAQVLAFARFDRAQTLAAMDAGRATWAPAVPTMLAAWTATPDDDRVAANVRSALSAGAPLPRDLRERAERRLGCPVRQGYGLTEATFSTIDDGRGDGPADGSDHVGAPVWGVELRIRDERGADQPADQEGEVWVRGANVMAGYLDDDAATRAVFDGDWLRTGDLGRLDTWGRLVLVDRLKDLILRGGANVYPSEVEDALSLHPAVAQVAVIGRPDDYYGEEVVAVIVSRGDAPSAAELDAHARAHLAKNKLPVEYVFATELPLGPSGKVLKRTLRERYASGRRA